MQAEQNAHQDNINNSLSKELKVKRKLKLVETFLSVNRNRFADIQDELDEFHHVA